MKTTILTDIDCLFSETAQLVSITEYGISWQDLLNSTAAIPAEGARFDISFEGTLEGPAIKGNIKGTDFLQVRADGRYELNIYATIITHDGETIAFYEDGLFLLPEDHSGKGQLRLNMKFTTASPLYSWMNKVQAWGTGTVDIHTGQIAVNAYVV